MKQRSIRGKEEMLSTKQILAERIARRSNIRDGIVQTRSRSTTLHAVKDFSWLRVDADGLNQREHEAKKSVVVSKDWNSQRRWLAS